MFWPWRRAGGGEWLPKACNRKVRKVWAAGQSHNTELFQQHPEVLDATPRIALMTPGRREMKGKPHFLPMGLTAIIGWMRTISTWEHLEKTG